MANPLTAFESGPSSAQLLPAIDLSMYLDLCQHLSAISCAATDMMIQAQLGWGRLATEELKAWLALGHVAAMGAALPDPMTDPSLWWTTENLVKSLGQSPT